MSSSLFVHKKKRTGCCYFFYLVSEGKALILNFSVIAMTLAQTLHENVKRGT
jgi:hypothetical protein